MINNKLENFEAAFSGNTYGCRRTCECGHEYWDTCNHDYDWEPGEVESLEKDPNATGVDYAIGTIEFEGCQYADACTCWHERAKTIMGFIDGHAREIAKYLSLEKQRKQRIADAAPIVE